MTKHTPGPWTVRERQTSDGRVVSEHGSDLFTIECNGLFIAAVKQPRKVARANARLIAAAPDLLEIANLVSLRSCDCDIMPEYYCLHCRAMDAIAKTEEN